ncbi:MAG: 30S ribosomal protein S11 [Fimbriimonadaceae bacterium]|jgi:small subunit ribosomal protein S11
MARKPATKGKAQDKRQVSHGQAHIHATFNNTIVSICDPEGNVLCWSSAGHVNFKGSRKGTPFAAQLAAEDCAKKSFGYGLRSIDVYITGPGAGRETAVRSLSASGLSVKTIRDCTPVPHNGCRPPKKRRV